MANGKSEEWRQKAHEVIKDVASKNSIVVSDMVVAALEKAGLGLDNYSPLGGVFTRAAKEGILQKTQETQQSTRAKSNSAKTVWISLIYQQDGISPEARVLNSMLIAALDFNAETVRYASIIYRSGGLESKELKTSLDKFQAMQQNYSARMAIILEEYEKVGGKK